MSLYVPFSQASGLLGSRAKHYDDIFATIGGAILATGSSYIQQEFKRIRLEAPTSSFYGKVAADAQDEAMAFAYLLLASSTATKQLEYSSPETLMSSAAVRTVFVKDHFQVNHSRKTLIGNAIHHYRVDNFISQNTEGSVNLLDVGVLGTQGHWLTDVTGANSMLETPVRWLSLNPNQGIAAGEHYPAQTDPANDSLMLDHVTQIFEFVNLSNNPAFCELIAFKCKDTQLVNQSVVAQMATAYTDLAVDATVTLPLTNVAPTGTLNFGAAVISLPWAAHYPNTRQLRSTWGKLKDWKFELPAGGRLNLRLSISMNMLGVKGDIGDSQFYPEDCLAYSFASFGAPDITDQAGSAAGQMVHSIAKVGCIVTSMLKFRQVKSQMTDKRFTAFYNIAAANTVAQESHMESAPVTDVISKVAS